MKNLLILLLPLVLTSCATMYTGTRQVVHFDSNPQGATVYLNSEEIGQTPFTKVIKRKHSKQVASFEKEGYNSYDQKLNKKFNAITLVWPFFTPIDLATGSIYKYRREYYNINLEPTDKITASTSQRGLFYILNHEDDTTFCEPTQKVHRKYLEYTTLDGQKNTASWKEIKEFRTLEKYFIGIGYGLLSCRFNIKFHVAEFVTIPLREGKTTTFVCPLESILSNGEYHLLRDYYSFSTYDGTDGTGYTVTKPVYFLYKGKEKVCKVKNKNCEEIVNKYFNNYKTLATMLKKKSKLKTVEDYYLNYYDFYDPAPTMSSL
ncbi:PEGA domain-containing protein [Marinilabiliaceae bacterium JC017]|nr:PEGA domain-containing protein [Marinilabiliaceae bacterium JC017]